MTVKTPIADVLGGLKADAANIKEEISAAQAQLIGLAAQDGDKVFEGEMFRAVISFGSKRVTDYKGAIRELQARYGISQDVIDGILIDNTEIAEGVPSVRVTARKAS